MTLEHDWIAQGSDTDYEADHRPYCCRNCPANFRGKDDDLPVDECPTPACPECGERVMKDIEWEYIKGDSGTIKVDWECEDCGHWFQSELPDMDYNNRKNN